MKTENNLQEFMAYFNTRISNWSLDTTAEYYEKTILVRKLRSQYFFTPTLMADVLNKCHELDLCAFFETYEENKVQIQITN